MSGKVLNVTDSNFDTEVLKSEHPVLVDFWAPWCGPCRMVGPVVEKLSEEFDGKVKFVKVNVDESPRISQNYGITGIPALYIFKSGADVDKTVGAAPIAKLRNMIEKNI